MRLYTVEEARTALPEVIDLVMELRDAFVELRALQATISTQSRGASGDGHLLADPWDEAGENRLETLSKAVQRAAAGVDLCGVGVEEPQRGPI